MSASHHLQDFVLQEIYSTQLKQEVRSGRIWIKAIIVEE